MPDLHDVLQQVEKGEISAADAENLIRSGVEQDLGFAKVDTDRQRRRGMPEVILCSGKTSAQIVDIILTLKQHGQDVLATRATPEQYDAVKKTVPDAVYNETARLITLDVVERPKPEGLVTIVCAGTSDIPVAEEAAITAERLGANVERIYDVGVAGLHRTLKHIPALKSARAIVVIAGMEGALPSVIGGLVDKPIVAVPTSVGYGTGLNGFAALLTMLNSCVPGISVVNIDNGFGAGVAAAMINRLPES